MNEEQIEALVAIYKMVKQAYRAGAIADWFDEDGDGLKSCIKAYEALLKPS